MGGSCRAGPGSARARPPRRGAATRAEAAPRRKDPCGVCCRAKVAHWLNGGKLQLACCSRRFPRRKSSPSVQVTRRTHPSDLRRASRRPREPTLVTAGGPLGAQ
nr:uncharacterized protein LOC125181428 isoform X3 [Anser cygnoides]